MKGKYTLLDFASKVRSVISLSRMTWGLTWPIKQGGERILGKITNAIYINHGQNEEVR